MGFAVLVCLGALHAVHATSPPDQYAPFGTTAGVVRDAKTGLEWERFVPEASSSYAQAWAHCEARSNDWRLPTLKELQTIMDGNGVRVFHVPTGGMVTRMIDVDVFPNTPTDLPFWTATPVSNNDSAQWAVDFSDGETDQRVRGDPGYVRCVRFVPSTP